MNPGCEGCSSESKSIIKDATDYLRKTVSCEGLQLKDQAWDSFLAETNLSSDEAVALQEALNKLRTDRAAGDKDTIRVTEEDIKRLLEWFPWVKVELEKWIKELQDLADHIDKSHRDCTISQVVAGSVGTTSGLGNLLALMTGGHSVGLPATVLGLGAAAAASGVSTSILDKSTSLSAKTKARELASVCDFKDVVNAVLPLFCINTKNCNQESSNMMENTSARELGKFLLSRIQLLSNVRRVSMGTHFAGTTRDMTAGSQILGMATRSFLLLIDVFNLVQDSKNLYEVAKAESTGEMREQAQELEKKLHELNRIYEILKEEWNH